MRFVLVIVVVAVAYAVGWVGDAWLNDDPCIGVGRETDTTEAVEEWFPARTDCRVTTPDGVVTVTRGPTEEFWSLFGFTLIAGAALLASGRLALRLVVVVAAAVAALLVSFIA